MAREGGVPRDLFGRDCRDLLSRGAETGFHRQRFVHGVDGLANPKGFITVTPHVASMKNANIYAAAVAVAIAPPGPTPVLVAVPKTGHMTELMAKAAA
jgi:sulfide:quinone oxidoreductase